MATLGTGNSSKKKILALAGMLVGICLAAVLLAAGFFLLRKDSGEPQEAPESEAVLNAQIGLPFQVLIPAYLPPIFKRDEVNLVTDAVGPNGEPMIKITYPTIKGNSLTLSEWIPEGQTTALARKCLCMCKSPDQCEQLGVEMTSGNVQIRVEYNIPNLLTYTQLDFMLTTLGPAANQQMFTEVADIPITYNLPPATEIPLNSEGIQEVTLVVSSQGYSPAHFSVQKGQPVRLIFRQLGYVGCGNELYIDLGGGETAYLILETQDDKEVLEFTPVEAGEFSIHCPHYIYVGAMTVKE